MTADTHTNADESRMKDRAQDAQQTAQARIREQVDVRSTQAGEQVSATATALRATSDKLREEGQDGPARAAEQVAGRTERLGTYLTQSDGDRILHDVEDFGRRQPLAVVGLGLVAGVAASRLLKASSRRRYESRELQAGPTFAAR
jgi:hypothetical protein